MPGKLLARSHAPAKETVEAASTRARETNLNAADLDDASCDLRKDDEPQLQTPAVPKEKNDSVVIAF